ncbi:hypothetical protein GCM10010512_40970 [Streptomyces thermoviolaceus subsp. thermoviolaceus]|nr:hypothetical protein GCM10010512_40970 [Streptomyces thermoviolaceus subsp. thermoviolaceus]
MGHGPPQPHTHVPHPRPRAGPPHHRIHALHLRNRTAAPTPASRPTAPPHPHPRAGPPHHRTHARHLRNRTAPYRDPCAAADDRTVPVAVPTRYRGPDEQR